MSEVQKECMNDLKELLLERITLFEGQQENNQQTINSIHAELKVCVSVCVRECVCVWVWVWARVCVACLLINIPKCSIFMDTVCVWCFVCGMF